MFKSRLSLTAVIAGATLVSAVAAQAGDISGAGATFPYPIYSDWAKTYKEKTGTGLNYQAIGSGGGIKQIEARTVTFGASDKPLGGDELKANTLVQFPTVMGGIVPVVNVDGIKPGELVLDGATLAKIYEGKITKWNDPAMAKLNEGVKLPDAAIAVVHRSDGSGTTFNFTYYLAAVDQGWKDDIGVSTAVEWPVGLGAKGNQGVAANVDQTKNSIGYVEYAYALQNHMTYTDMINKDGKRVAPKADAFAAAAANADWSSQPGFGVILANQPGEATWPMTAATFILMHSDAKDGAASADALKFFDWAYANGGAAAAKLDYIPMPASVVSQIKAEWTQIKGKDGASVWAMNN
ncbi:phosphate ABC transporter substrate-binding protein PstS [Thioclava sp. L04-15]|uniref:phosphate ABC transporter substrate-binding protein PstS n=1 Tax=Thioclava sp. L04-15 TaxID=1915318 RepID=UPI000996549C|nr:phosphate ABC transporter substrate-binding protein PstS [Thioclava sp. L04-15]OOY27078.1 phosphate ABC transporter substrate-binding protein PstS [Thioclava sp. L04-15]TNE92700.1 MAG: phosphate ABC transporter substrate-binding protein PstS [Paracoccaceae bacterium]